jgi:hypothetical protein
MQAIKDDEWTGFERSCLLRSCLSVKSQVKRVMRGLVYIINLLAREDMTR